MRLGANRPWLWRVALAMLASVACVFAATMIEIASFDASSGQRADAAIVLGAASWGLTPSPVFRERIRQAVSLYRSGQVRKIIFTGGRRLDTDSYEAEVGRSAMSAGLMSFPKSWLVARVASASSAFSSTSVSKM